MRPTPFALVFAGLAAERFPAIAAALDQASVSSADRDHFVLLEPVGRLLREMVPPGAGADVLEAHALLLHHAYRHWAAEGWIYGIAEATLARATAATAERLPLTSRLPRPALYLQLPELRVWGTPSPNEPPEPLDGAFVTEQVPSGGGIAVLAIFGMRPDRPGFSAVALEGRADPGDAMAGEIEVAAARADGTPLFAPTVAGGDRAGIYSIKTHGELLLLICRLLALLPLPSPAEHAAAHASASGERLVRV